MSDDSRTAAAVPLLRPEELSQQGYCVLNLEYSKKLPRDKPCSKPIFAGEDWDWSWWYGPIGPPLDKLDVDNEERRKTLRPLIPWDLFGDPYVYSSLEWFEYCETVRNAIRKRLVSMGLGSMDVHFPVIFEPLETPRTPLRSQLPHRVSEDDEGMWGRGGIGWL